MLITSISGIRGTIGGEPGTNLTPPDIVGFVSAYGSWILSHSKNPTIVVGRDGRKSGKMILDLAVQTLIGLGINVINLDFATTPTVEMSVISNNSNGAIIITASHNPKEYNGLKMLNGDGEFLSAAEGQEILDLKEKGIYNYANVDGLGIETKSYNHTKEHIEKILDLELVDVDAVRAAQFKISLDAINSVGGIAMPMLLEKMGVEVVGLYCECNGDFQHKPEPLEQNLGDLKSLVIKTESDLGIAVDPDVDRLVMVDEHGEMINEEYTIVMIADYVLSHALGNTVSNLSSSRALRDVTERHNQNYYASAVGEKNVVEKMKEVNAVIGGEGSGGVIYPELHYGRDALVGIALFLSSMGQNKQSASTIREQFKNYYMAKEKVALPDIDSVLVVLDALAVEYADTQHSRIDGLKIDFKDSWVHIRASNTEPILRIYAEALTQLDAEKLAHTFITKINELL